MLGVIGILMGDVVTPDQAGIPFPLEDGESRAHAHKSALHPQLTTSTTSTIATHTTYHPPSRHRHRPLLSGLGLYASKQARQAMAGSVVV